MQGADGRCVMTEALMRAIDELKAGRAVIFPTDTVCGLGVAPRFAKSPQEVYDLKRRTAGKPIAWLVGSPTDLDRYGTGVTEQARCLAKEGWPGALTIIVKASAEVPLAFQSEQGTIGLRMPASNTALALIDEVGPLATSSANRAGSQPPQSIDDVDSDLLSEVAAFVRSDEQASGIASKVIDATGDALVIVRE